MKKVLTVIILIGGFTLAVWISDPSGFDAPLSNSQGGSVGNSIVAVAVAILTIVAAVGINQDHVDIR